MTDVMERPAVLPPVGAVSARTANREHRLPRTNPECPATVHGTANARNNKRCKCPEAIAAYNASVARGRPVRRIRPAAVDEQGRCVADRHDSYLAWVEGCRCPTSVEKREQYRAGIREQGRARTGGGRPWHQFRGPQMRVNRVNLILLLSGFVDNPTYMERVVAANILHRRGLNGRRLTPGEIGERIGGYGSWCVAGYLKRFAELAEKRTERRLADVKRKAARR